MPLLDWNLKSTWDLLYNVPDPNKSKARLGYDKAYFKPLATGQVKTYVDLLKIKDGQSIVILGGAYGWTVEAFNEDYPNIKVVNIDNSTHIHSTKEVTTTILNEDMDSAGSIDIVKAELGKSTIDWVITEDVLPCMSDADIITLLNRLDTFALNVCHKITARASDPIHVALSDDDYPAYGIEVSAGGFATSHDAGLNWKTLPEWVQLLNSFNHKILIKNRLR